MHKTNQHTLLAPLLLLTIFAATVQAEYKLIWSDEFDETAIDRKVWQAESKPGVVYNAQQRQFHTDRSENSFVEDGQLVIRARQERFSICDYTSARLNTYGKFGFRYGKVEARMKLPSGQGLRTKLFLLPERLTYGTWARSGQIDVVAAAGANPNSVNGGIFHGGQGHYHEYSGGTHTAEGVDFSEDFHVYSVEWQPYEIRWFVDGKLYSMQNKWRSFSAKFPAPFDHKFYLGLSLAVEGDTDDGAFPAELRVDWIRVSQIAGDNQPPEIKITSPSRDATVPTGELQITVDASDADGDLERVDFYNHQELLGASNQPPYQFVWDAPDGCHTLIARAVDRAGLGRSHSVDIVAGRGCPPGPYHGTPAVLPGRVEAEDFDTSPREKAYWDWDDHNNGGAYRDTAVDIQDCQEGGYNIGWIENGEWLEYTVDVQKAGKYDIVCRVGSPHDGGKLHVKLDGVNQTGTLEVVNTGDWQNYTHVIKHDVELKAGVQKMKIVVENGGFNLNYVEVNAAQ